jgi:FG-GAP-like repeat/Abnormal spindle-like microcephaly-assoc'd, ASPM-SPD-2-Hydin
MRPTPAFFYTSFLILISLSAITAAQSNPVPFLNQALSPVSSKPGSAAFTLTVSGTGFASSAVVNWNGSGRLTEVISSSQLRATINAADVAKAGTASVTVTNAAPGGGTSNVVFFPVREPLTAVAMAASQPFVSGAVVTGNFVNGGKLDVAISGTADLNVYPGKGNGTFGAPISTPYALGASQVMQMVTGDFNRDGNLDLAGLPCCPELGELFLGNGAGGFPNVYADRFGTNGYQNVVATADFNGDGNLDLYVTGWDLGNQWFTIYLGKGDGSFQALPNQYVGYFPGLPAIGDFNGDGILDLAVPGDLAGVDIFLGNGDGSFREAGGFQPGASSYVAAADMNHDGKLDLVSNSGCILLGNADGTFSAGGCGSTGSGFPLVGDFNGDGNLDVALLGAILLGDGKGGFLSTVDIPAGSGAGPIGALGDFNNDGMLDLVTSGGLLLLQSTAGVLPSSLSFGSENVGTKSSPQTVTLANVGTSPLAVTKISIAGTGASDFKQTNNCGTSVAAASNCTIDVSFAPTAGGTFNPSLTLSYKGVGSPQKVALAGTGVTAPKPKLTPTSLKFTTQLVGTTSAAQTVALSNSGGQTLIFSGAGISTTGAFSQTNNCGSGVVDGGTCQIQVTFQPTAAGTATGTLTVSDNAAGSPQKVTLSGSGTVITLSPEAVNFGSQKVGTKSSTASITLNNTGAIAVSITAVSVAGTDPGDFAQTNSCGKSLAAHSSCMIGATFKPTATGARSGTVSVTDSGGGSPQTVALSGTGT